MSVVVLRLDPKTIQGDGEPIGATVFVWIPSSLAGKLSFTLSTMHVLVKE